MTISSTTSRNNYTGNGATSVYSYSFRILDESDLLVTKKLISTGVETTLVLTTDYTVSGVGDASGGSITLVAGSLASTYTLSIRRVLTLTQDTDIRNQGEYYPDTIEDEFDRGVMISQQQQDEIDRSVQLPESVDPSTFDTDLPATLVGSVNVVVMTNASGDGFAVGPTATDISSAQTNAASATASASAASASASAASTSASNAAASAASAASTLSSAVTLTGVQAVTNKDYQGGTASNASRITVPSAAKATLDGLTRKAATIVYGTDTKVLYADDGTTLNPVSGNYLTSAKSANYVITDTDQLRHIFVTTGSSTIAITLPTASTNTNRMITIKKVDSGSGKVTATGTLDGMTNYDLLYLNEAVTVVSDGTNWNVSSYAPSDWLTFTPSLAKRSGSGTLGTSTTNFALFRKFGKVMHVTMEIVAITITTNTVSLQITLPMASVKGYKLPPIWVQDNSTQQVGRAFTAAASATLGIDATISGGAFAISAAATECSLNFSYQVA